MNLCLAIRRLTYLSIQKNEGEDIKSLKCKETYCIVDPGTSSDSSLVPEDFPPKLILVTSPNERHWGGNEFRKRRDKVGGLFRFCPVWSMEELVEARPFFVPEITKEIVLSRYSRVGGVPRHIFCDEDCYQGALDEQVAAIDLLTPTDTDKFATQRLNFKSFSEDQPKSALLSIDQADSNDLTFDKCIMVTTSDYVMEMIVDRHMDDMWDSMLLSEDKARVCFEPYCRALLARKGKVKMFSRACVGKANEAYNNITSTTIGGCVAIKQVVDIVESSKKEANVIFHPFDKNYPLIDFIY